MINALDTVTILENRLEFLDHIIELAKTCSWPVNNVEELRKHVLQSLIRIDNMLFDVYDKTNNYKLSYIIWESHMEDLRRWLSLILGIEIYFN